MADDVDLPDEVAYYYPSPYWRLDEADYLKSLLLFFDSIAILLPRYMYGRQLAADPVLAVPLTELGYLKVLEPETFVDQEMAEQLATAMVALITEGAFDDLEEAPYYAELSQSRMGWDADIRLSQMLIEGLLEKNLARPSEDGVSVPLHPTVRTTILVLLSQLARSAGQRQGLDLHPTTPDRKAVSGLLQTLSLPSMPSAGQIVTLDLNTVGVNLETVPLDDVISFRDDHRAEFRAYTGRIRQLVAELSVIPEPDRSRLLLDHTEELADLAADLQKIARRAWMKPFAALAIGAAGAVWTMHDGDPVSAGLAFSGTALGITGGKKPDAGAYTYVFDIQRSLR